MRHIRAELTRERPEFAVITENISDVLCSSYDIVHGGGFGSRDGPQSFPALFRYTVPETILTNRMVGIDELPDLAFAMLHGFRFDLEPLGARGHMGMVPELAARVRQLCDVRRRLAPSLLRGTFVDDVGVAVEGAQLAAKAFVGDGQAAVVCWNTGDAPAQAEPRFEGRAPDSTHLLDPDGDDRRLIAPGGLAVFVYER
jgi:hypothetical protein